jgi:Arc/MetJ-type ribon-helix-helix transcriptional regulator
MFEVIVVMVAKSVSIDLDDLTEIQKKLDNGESNSLSEFIRNAIKKELEG